MARAATTQPETKDTARLEMYTHCIVRGPRAHLAGANKITHSHAGGDTQHSHEGTGPAAYTIDKDEWFDLTGRTDGGRIMRTHAGNLKLIQRGPAEIVRLTWARPRLIASMGEILG